MAHCYLLPLLLTFLLKYGIGRVNFFQTLTIVLSKLYIPSTLNIDIILWHTQLIVCAENVKSQFKSWIFPFTFQAYILPYTLNLEIVGE